MKLIVKFNLVLLMVFLLGMAATAYVSHELLHANARSEIRENARILMDSALAVRKYTSEQIKPLLETQMKYEFLPQSVPSYSATEYFSEIHRKFPEYSYKEAALNPTNPRDRAADWEADIVHAFRSDEGKTEVFGERDTPNGRTLFLARPLKIKDPACLLCHSTVEIAPKTMLDKYGTANGFGWNLNETIGAQVVSVPMQVPIERANNAFKVFMALFGMVFAFLFVSMNLLLWLLVVRPVNRLARIADQVSLGDMDAPEFVVKGRDEIARLGESFNRMKKSLVQAFKMISG
jgi:HAMP domain-containing protein